MFVWPVSVSLAGSVFVWWVGVCLAVSFYLADERVPVKVKVKVSLFVT